VLRQFFRIGVGLLVARQHLCRFLRLLQAQASTVLELLLAVRMERVLAAPFLIQDLLAPRRYRDGRLWM
jgi:hypothetical protein